jgi:hypothetical protein
MLAPLSPPAVFLQFIGLDIRIYIDMLFGIGHLTERTRPATKPHGVARTDTLPPREDTPRL